MSKIVLAVIVTAIIVGGGVYYWQPSKQTEPAIVTQPPSVQSDLETYSSDKYSFKYPNGYKINDSYEYVLHLTKEGNTELVIFQAKEGHYGEGGVSIEATQEEIDSEVPKKRLTVDNGENKYDVWIYYSKDDATAESELNAIFDSIVVK